MSTWNIDPTHSHAEFKVRHLMISNVKGSFPKISGVLTLDESDLGQVQRRGYDRRRLHRNPRSAARWPPEERRLLRRGEVSDDDVQVDQGYRDHRDEGTVEGDLTIRGVTKPVVFQVEGPTPPTKDPWGNLRVAVSATAKISRKEFGLTWNAALEGGGVMVGDEVTITLEVEFVKA